MASESCVTALYIALSHREKTFDELLNYTIQVGGDVDTIAAMAGSIWGACRGYRMFPSEKINRLENSDRLKSLAKLLSQRISN